MVFFFPLIIVILLLVVKIVTSAIKNEKFPGENIKADSILMALNAKDNINHTDNITGGLDTALTKFHSKSKYSKYDTRQFTSILTVDGIGSIYRDLCGDRDRTPIHTVAEIPLEIPYHEGTHIFTPTVHNGQFKLFMREFNAANLIMADADSSTDPIYIVYAGSSPCNKLYLLAEMFPRFKFILVDPNETLIYTDVERGMRTSHYKNNPGDIIYFRTLHDNRYEIGSRKQITALIDGKETVLPRDDFTPDKFSSLEESVDYILADTSHRIYIFEDFMTMEFAEILSKIPRLHFWSDIRTNSGDSKSPSDVDIIWNISQQYNWIVRMRPETYSLKFRVPYYDVKSPEETWAREPYLTDLTASAASIDFIANYAQHKYIYLAGDLFIQSFPGKSSTEVGLFGKTSGGVPQLMEYNISEFENKLFYYNLIERQLHHKNPLVNPTTRKIGFDHCNCCALTAEIFLRWAAAHPELIPREKSVGAYCSELIVRLAATTGRNFLRNGHGSLINPASEKYYTDLFREWSHRYIN